MVTDWRPETLVYNDDENDDDDNISAGGNCE